MSLLAATLALAASPAAAAVKLQCPGDKNGDGVSDTQGIVCLSLSAGDGFVTMADGKPQYMFGFGDVTGVRANKVMEAGMLGARFPAPLISVDEGDHVYLNLTNVGMMMRPDLFDPHTVHWHGFPQASAVFDGVPDSSISINMGSTLTYYYQAIEPGTYMYHCHVEATEHMQMGMLGNLYVRPAQNKKPNNFTFPNGFVHKTNYKYAYNDNDGSTYYDVEYAIQMTSFDSFFHDQHEAVQPLPFALMKDDYPMLNGRGYPDTVNPSALPPPAANGGIRSQLDSSLIRATAGQKVLLRLSNLSVTKFFTLSSLGIPMRAVGRDARLYRGPDGKSLYFETNSITLGGGEAMDVILDTAGINPGTYFLYTTNLNYLSNGTEDFGGMMTEIRIN